MKRVKKKMKIHESMLILRPLVGNVRQIQISRWPDFTDLFLFFSLYMKEKKKLRLFMILNTVIIKC